MSTTLTPTARYMATNLYTVMRQQGRKFRWLADRVGWEPSGLTHVARGRRSVDAERAQRIADVLGVPVEMIFAQTANGATMGEEDGA